MRKHNMEHSTTNKDEAYKLFFGSLANLNRLKIINAMGAGPKCVSELISTTNFEQTMVSHNLKRLERCGMVFAQKKGKYCYYTLNKETIKPLMNLIDEHMNKYCIHIVNVIRSHAAKCEI